MLALLFVSLAASSLANFSGRAVALEIVKSFNGGHHVDGISCVRSSRCLLCVASPVALAADQVRIAVSSTSLFFASGYVAKQMSYFDENGIDVTVIDVGSGSNVIASVVGGSAEIGGAGIRNISQGVEKGQAVEGVQQLAERLSEFPGRAEGISRPGRPQGRQPLECSHRQPEGQEHRGERYRRIGRRLRARAVPPRRARRSRCRA